MKFIRKRPSGVDKDIPVFEFAFGIEELKLLTGIVQTARKNLPDIFELMPMKRRMNNIKKEFLRVLDEYKSQK